MSADAISEMNLDVDIYANTKAGVYTHVCGCVDVDRGTKFDEDVDVNTVADCRNRCTC